MISSLPAQTAPQNQQPQTSPGDDEVVRITTNLVQIDAVVTDKNGKPVTDLRAEDFVILEDKRPQKITAFSYVSTDRVASQAEPPIDNARLQLDLKRLSSRAVSDWVLS